MKKKDSDVCWTDKKEEKAAEVSERDALRAAVRARMAQQAAVLDQKNASTPTIVLSSRKERKVAPAVELPFDFAKSEKVDLFDVPPLEVARQITLLDFWLFVQIPLQEFHLRDWLQGGADCPRIMVTERRDLDLIIILIIILFIVLF
jgi:hypothetical protein